VAAQCVCDFHRNGGCCLYARSDDVSDAARPIWSVIVHNHRAPRRHSIPVPGDNLTNPTAPTVGTGIVVEAGTNYRVHVRGNITATYNQAWDCLPGLPSGSVTYGPTGAAAYDNAAFQVVVRARNTDGTGTNPISFIDRQVGSDSVRTDILHASKQIEIEAGRLGVIGACSHNDGSPSIPAYLLSGSQMVSVEKLTDVVQLNAVPNRVHPNTQVTFTASRDDGGNPQVTSWHWQPDDAAHFAASNPCWWLNPCQMNIPASGNMTVNTNFGPKTVHVDVYTNFTLDVDKTAIKAGDTATFTPKVDGVQTTVGRWRFVPDTIGTAETHACAGSTNTCMKQMIHSGTMIAYLSSDPLAPVDSATKHVTVSIDCPTGDSILDSWDVRQGLKQMWLNSGPNVPPGDGIQYGDTLSQGNKREHGIYILKTVDGVYYSVDDPGTYANECRFTPGGALVKRNPGDALVAHGHSHPTDVGDAVYGCPDGANLLGSTTKYQRYPGEPGRSKATKGSDIDWGGGSESDWIQVDTRGQSEYVFNNKGEVWHLPVLDFPSDQPHNRDVHQVRTNPNNSCNW
jgi:hypothetical protein